jgi:hypothetical protein
MILEELALRKGAIQSGASATVSAEFSRIYFT